MEAFCGMLNGTGRGQVLFGDSDKGEIVGQDVADRTMREIANASRRIEPAADVKARVVRLRGSHAVLAVDGMASGESKGHDLSSEEEGRNMTPGESRQIATNRVRSRHQDGVMIGMKKDRANPISEM